jgi:diguanylate cyclase (GGDEF)-like protein/PAS domain S-box-containing protein
MPEAEVAQLLYMEDDTGLARLLKKKMERLGYQVDLAADGEAGLALIAGHRFDAVLIDYNMPVLSGLEVMKRIAAMELPPPAIMLTGNGNEKIAVEAMKLGAVDYMVKDVEMGYLELLPIVLDQVLERERLVRERTRMLKEVQESEERYRKLVELSPDGIFIHSGGKFDYINPAGVEILGGVSSEELVGRDVMDIVHPDFHQVFLDRLTLLEKPGLDLPWMEEKILRLDGTAVDVELTALPFLYKGIPATQTIFRDITERKLAKQRLERMANFDALTGVPNRTLLFDRLHQRLYKAKRWGEMFALLFLDLDHFKKLNDTMGHYCGDIILKEVASRLVASLRESDTVARMGGDEFVVLLPKIAEARYAAQVAEKIIAALAKPIQLAEKECFVSTSIGISIYPNDGTDADLLLIMADTAMYSAKEQGRNCYQFSSGSHGN